MASQSYPNYPASQDRVMFNHHDSNQPGLRQARNDQRGVINQHHSNILMDLAQPLPDPPPPPALSVDNGPSNSDGENLGSWKCIPTQIKAYNDLPRGCLDVGNTFAAVSCGPWQGNGDGAQLHPAHGTMATGWIQQPFVPVDAPFPPPQSQPVVDPNLGPTFPHTPHGPSPSGQEGYLNSSFSVQTCSDPWSPETALSRTRPASQIGYERACSGGSPPSVRTPSQDQSSISEALSQGTPISSQQTGTGRMADSMMTLVANHANERRFSDAIETDYNSWESGHGLDSSNNPQASQNTGNSHMLARFLETSRLDSSVITQPVYPENQNPRFLAAIDPNTNGASISRSPSTMSRVSLILSCEFCGKEYTGEYRKGNLARHRRQKHGIEEQVYPCEEPGCLKEFKRQDARLKHYRGHHPHLAPVPLVSRTS